MDEIGHTHAPASLGWLLVGHGTRDPAGRAEFLELAENLARRAAQTQPHAIVEPAFLELAEPTIAAGLTRLATRGVRRVLVVPLLLFAAGHAKDDIPQAVAAAAADLGLEVVGQAGALESQPLLLELSRRRFQEAAGEAVDRAETLLLMVGRGGSDETALAAMRSYTQCLAANLGVAGETAFVAIGKPSLAEMLSELAKQPGRCVVVQPHLLFRGEVLSTIVAQLNTALQEHPEVDWRMASHLRADELVVEALLARIAEQEVK
jgi:sirohydrochlorin cobaltochelatase